MPVFLWEKNDYDPEDLTAGMFRNSILVTVFKHIFTSPSSALQDQPKQTKTKGSQAKRNKMTSVTASSIAYTCVQYRHAISTITDWRVEDRLFDRDEFYDSIIKMFYDGEDEDPDWRRTPLNGGTREFPL
ncbi:hypothetical protein GALMADRAFT_65929 [Galerina marginata CBS 339.88]|uniref:Uncharacterized protein n=1 Tax=Galerina marginata (strain CBS 339.88) TaxID=685588 RepID=A0A067TC67_GALM3|nr:hypothetical protein GALMADRAFT_65929 [Galerina marginata CBS 339.88]